ncbi:MAG: ExbD/TolR family protein, partial [Terrimicrobiaceae bacterium]
MFARPKRPTLSIDMAPLIDVVFLLLIFFMLTSSFVPPSVPLTLPQAAS